MTLTPTGRFALRPLSLGDRDAVPVAVLADDGVETGTRLAGVVLEGQFACRDGFLVITSDDCPFEEAVHIHLLANDLSRSESLTIAQAYAGGIVRGLHAEGPDSIAFSFYGDDLWRVTVLPRAKYIWQFRPFSGIRADGAWFARRRLRITHRDDPAP